LAIVLLAALLFRAYIPVGFMPALGSPFQLQFCPAAYGATSEHHAHHHSPVHADFQNCPFGTAPAAGPVSHFIVFAPPGRIDSFERFSAEPARLRSPLPRAHRPRGPPSLV
jgi:hypothetical protein